VQGSSYHPDIPGAALQGSTAARTGDGATVRLTAGRLAA
jgi:hypothetical protein